MKLSGIGSMALAEMVTEHMDFAADTLQYDDRTDTDQLRRIVEKGKRLMAKTEKIIAAAKK